MKLLILLFFLFLYKETSQAQENIDFQYNDCRIISGKQIVMMMVERMGINDVIYAYRDQIVSLNIYSSKDFYSPEVEDLIQVGGCDPKIAGPVVKNPNTAFLSFIETWSSSFLDRKFNFYQISEEIKAEHKLVFQKFAADVLVPDLIEMIGGSAIDYYFQKRNLNGVSLETMTKGNTDPKMLFEFLQSIIFFELAKSDRNFLEIKKSIISHTLEYLVGGDFELEYFQYIGPNSLVASLPKSKDELVGAIEQSIAPSNNYITIEKIVLSTTQFVFSNPQIYIIHGIKNLESKE